ncbi:PilZ domain-containing protein [Sphingomonas sp. MA1305]|uniref:PilZ domain-containing protein n=1 Tax=Sphingomonas sp. MA1305 TaxID=2479204 RepID=UPI0018DF0246|nr:PilZ domain-containing protein [Sphingomonas sp. MA1305]MBI0477206.1 PilZ domain-containing protein [Sphingomonas sp. MA1305]
MSFVAKLYEDDRSAERYPVLLDGTLRNPQAEPQDVVIDDLSATGFRTATARGLAVGDTITLGIFGVGLRTARVQRASDGHYGCQFVAPLTAEELASALAGLAPPDPIRFPAPELGASVAVDQPVREWSLSPRMRVLCITAVGVAPWLLLGLAWRLI